MSFFYQIEMKKNCVIFSAEKRTYSKEIVGD